MMGTKILAIDDSFNERLRILALTGILAPVDVYAAVQEDVVGRLFDRLETRQRTLWAHAPELHGSDFLRENHPSLPPDLETSDELRFAVVDDVVSVLKDHGLSIVRGGYYVPPSPRDPILTREFFLQTSLLGLIRQLGRTELASHFVVPVMDMGSPSLMSTFNTMLAADYVTTATASRSGVSLGWTDEETRARRHLIGEIFFVNSQASILVQLADVAGYLLLVNDLGRNGHTLTPYKQRLLEFAQQLEGSVLHEEITVLQFNGEPTGPESLAFRRGLRDG